MLPNSIERTAPILGYDPYAFIMGKKSNIVSNNIRGNNTPDYFAKRPEDIYNNGEKVKKRFTLKSILKGAAGISAILIATAGIIAGGKKFKESSVAPIASSNGFIDKVVDRFNNTKTSVSNSTKTAGGFISKKAHSLADFVKKKFHKP